MIEIIEFAIICALLLWIWYSGGFSKKSQIPVVIPVPIGKCCPGCVCHLSLTNQPVIEDFIPVVLSVMNEDIDDGENAEIISSDNVATIEMNKIEDNETVPEVLMQQPLSHPQPDPEAAITNNKITDAIDPSWKPNPLPLAETDEPDDSDDEFIIPPDFFVNPNQTEPETIPAEAADEPEESDEEVKMATEEENVPLEADLTHQEAVTASQEDMMDSIVPDSPSPESPSPKRFSFQLTQLPYLPDGYYINLRLNERDNNSGKIKKTKIISTHPKWNHQQKLVSFEVHNTEEATLTTKLKRTTLFGWLKFTVDVKETDKLVNIEGKEFELLPDLNNVDEVKKIKKELAKKKKEERKLKGRLASCEQYGIDPFVRLGSDETFGLGQKKEKINIITEPEIKPKKISFWVRHGFLYPKDRYTRRRFE